MTLSFFKNSISRKLTIALPVTAAAIAAATFVAPSEKVSAQSGDIFQVWSICNSTPCTIGVAVPGWKHPRGWRSISGGFRGGARAWRHACKLHYNNSNYFSPDIANGVINCTDMNRQAATMDRGGNGRAAAGRGAGGSGANRIKSCPQNASNYRGKRATVRCKCTGQQTVAGRVWGTNPYTDDSDICRAGLHAGIIGSRGGTLTFRMVGGRKSYPSSTRNGVTSTVYREWPDSYTLSR